MSNSNINSSVSGLPKKSSINPSAFIIKVKLGAKLANLTIDQTKPLSSFAISFALKFTAEQRLFLKVNALKLIESGEINITEGEVIPMCDDLEIQNNDGPTIVALRDMKRLVKGGVYELVISDKREEYSSQLTEQELSDIKSHFNSMDLDQNGVLTTDEGSFIILLCLTCTTQS